MRNKTIFFLGGMLSSIVLFFPLTAAAQNPVIYARGVVNAAGYVPAGLPGGGIAQGSIFTIFGTNLGPSTSPSLAFPLSTTLGGVSIKVSQGATSVDAIPLFVSPNQINAIMPSTAAPGLASVRVTFNTIPSNPSTPVNVVPSSFGIFTVNGAGNGPGVLMNFVAQNNQPVNSTQVSATAGQAITMWGTGLGAGKGPDNMAPVQGTLPTPVEVWVGNQQAQVAYSGRSPCCAGVDQVVFNVPANAPHGCWVPVYVRTGGTTTSNVATMAVNTKSGACSDSTNPVLQTFLNGGPMGILTLFRSATHQTVDVATPVDITTDFVTLNAWNQKGGPFVFAPAISTPPAGTCTVYTSPGDFFASGSLSVPGTASSVLSTGTSITLTGPGGAKNVTLESNSGAINLGSYGTLLSLPNQLVLNPGNYTVADTAGANVGAFSTQVTIPAAFTWTNRDAGDVVDRSQPLQVTWSGVNAATSMSILGASVDLPTNSTAMFQCIAAPGETSFTVPAAILSALPPTRPTVLQNKSILFLSNGAISNGVKFTASGLSSSVAIPVLLAGKTVVFK